MLAGAPQVVLELRLNPEQHLHALLPALLSRRAVSVFLFGSEPSKCLRDVDRVRAAQARELEHSIGFGECDRALRVEQPKRGASLLASGEPSLREHDPEFGANGIAPIAVDDTARVDQLREEWPHRLKACP